MMRKKQVARTDDAQTESLQRLVPTGLVRGRFDAAFAEVAEEFVRGFTAQGELGASLCVRHAGRIVVDLWGGVADKETRMPWEEDTVSVVFSSTKGAVALCAHLLAAQGHLRFDQRVTHYWPEYGGGNKAGTTVQMVLDHTAGLPVLRSPLKVDCLEDNAYMVEHVEREQPFWQPGTAHGYHAITFGVVLGELVRRITGHTLGALFDQLIARPHGLDFWIGLPESVEPRVATILPMSSAEAPKTPFAEALACPGSIPNLLVFNAGSWSRRGINTRRGRAVEIPSANGVTNARGLSGLYELMQPGAHQRLQGLEASVGRLREAAKERRLGMDATLLIPTRFCDGFMLGMDNQASTADGSSLRIGDEAFGHCGSGGSVGFIDPARSLSFGYTMNRMGSGMLVNERGQSLIDATYLALERPDASN